MEICRNMSRELEPVMKNSMEPGTLRKCAYWPCQCAVPASLEYCSESCSKADNIEETQSECMCGHTTCDESWYVDGIRVSQSDGKVEFSTTQPRFVR